jgi:molecular chaperone DnaK
LDASTWTVYLPLTFDIDANGILNVSAKDKGTGKEQKIRIEASSGLTDQEIERMRNEAKANEDADRTAKERIDKLNAADSMIFQTEKQLKEYEGKLSEGNRTALQTALDDLKKAHQVQDLGGIDAAMAALNTAWQAASQEMYSAGPQGATPTDDSSQNQGSSADGSTVTDVDFEEVDNTKK